MRDRWCRTISGSFAGSLAEGFCFEGVENDAAEWWDDLGACGGAFAGFVEAAELTPPPAS